jgi:hypothetical protein
MPGLVPGIHVFLFGAKDVDGRAFARRKRHQSRCQVRAMARRRDKAGHDDTNGNE